MNYRFMLIKTSVHLVVDFGFADVDLVTILVQRMRKGKKAIMV